MEDRDWNIWVYDEMEQAAVPGYPSRSSIYMGRAAAGDVMDGLNFDDITDADWMRARQIGRAVRVMKRIDPAGYDLMITWYGIYAGAPDARNQRLMRLNMKPNRARELIREKRAWVEGFVEGRYGKDVAA